jgi:hypothetical protein
MIGIERGAVALILAIGAAAVLPHSLPAQQEGWQLTGGASQVWFGGGVEDTTGAGLRFSPTSTVAWGLAIDYPVGRVRIGLGLSYLSAHLELAGSGVRIVSEVTDLRQFEITAVVATPLLRVGQGGAGFSLSAGPALDIWTVTGGDSRTRAGVVGAVLFAAPISRDWKLLASAAGSLSGSPFEASELPVEFEPSTLRTGRVGFGVQYDF